MFLFSPWHAGIGLDLYIVEGAKPGFIYQVEAFDPEDTRQNTPLGVSLLAKLQRGFSGWSLTQEPGVSAGWAGWGQWEESAVHCQAQSPGEAGMGEGLLGTDTPHWIHGSV